MVRPSDYLKVDKLFDIKISEEQKETPLPLRNKLTPLHSILAFEEREVEGKEKIYLPNL